MSEESAPMGGSLLQSAMESEKSLRAIAIRILMHLHNENYGAALESCEPSGADPATAKSPEPAVVRRFGRYCFFSRMVRVRRCLCRAHQIPARMCGPLCHLGSSHRSSLNGDREVQMRTFSRAHLWSGGRFP